MPLENSLNISPYFDDFDEAKEFYRILFKPGFAVQTRELNQLQTILQNQVERFGNHVFKSGTIISGVNFNYLPSYSYVKILDVQVDGQPSLPQSYVGYFVKSSLNLTARVIDYKDGLEASDPDLKTIYVRYINSSDPDTSNSDAVYTTFAPGQQLTVFGENYPLFEVTVTNGGVGFSNSDTVVVSSSLLLANVTGTFSNGETITQSTTGAQAVIKAVNTTAIPNKTILKVAPRTADLTNTSVNSTAWTFNTNYSIVGGSSMATANVGSLIGSGATALLTTDTQGIIQTVTIADDGSDYTFLPWVTVKTSNATATVASLSLEPQNYKTKITVGNSTVNAIGTGYAFGVSEGLIYQKGFFLRVDPQTIIVDKYTDSPNNVVVGFKTEEQYVDSNEDESLFDNASNTTNYSAPGADRLKLVPVLDVLSTTTAAANLEFFPLVEWKEGYPFRENKATVYSTLADEMARRSREAHGNFVVDRFEVTTKEKSDANTTHVQVVVDPGLAYIEGYRVATSYNNYLDLERSTTTTGLTSQNITASYGNYIVVNELAGLFDFKAGSTVSLYNTAKTYITSKTIGSSGAITPAGSVIGTARIRSLVLDSGEPGTASCRYRMYLFDIAMSAGYSFRQVRSVYYDGAVQDGIADIVLTYDATSGTNIAKLVDANRDRLVFPVQGSGVSTIDNITYTYRTVSDATTQISGGSSGGYFQIGPLGSGLTHPYSDGAISTTQEKDFLLFPTANVEAYSNLTASSIGITSGCTVITGTGTSFASELQAGDFVRFANSTANVYFQIASVENNTSATLTTSPAASMTAANATLFFPALYPISFSRASRTITISGSSKTATLYIGTGTNTAVNAIAVYNIRATDVTPVQKTVNRDVFVKLHTSNNAGSNTGPWSLGVPGTIRLKNVYLGNSSNVGTTTNTTVSDVTKYFYVDYGDDENAYRLSKLVLKTNSGLSVNTNQYILAQFDVFTNSGTEGFFTIDSYPVNDTANLSSSSATVNTLEIPELVTTRGEYVDLKDAFDFRPYGSNTAALATDVASATVNPANTFTLNSDEKFFPAPDSTITFDVDYYNKRRDRVVVKKDGTFEVLKGTPTIATPVAPVEPAEAVTLAVLEVPPYPSLPYVLNAQTTKFAARRIGTNGVTSTRVQQTTIQSNTSFSIVSRQPRRYTMADIGKLDRRLGDVEYAVKMSLVEASVKDLNIPSSANPAVNRYKNGFFIDSFDDYSKSDTQNKEFKALIDRDTSSLRPAGVQLNVELNFNTSDSTTQASIVNNETLMLPYSEETLLNQSIKNVSISGDGQDVRFIGTGTISPPSFSIKSRGERYSEIAVAYVAPRGADWD